MNKNLLLLSTAAGIVFMALLSQQGAQFEGADAIALNAINRFSPSYVPWVKPLFQPPSTEVESLIFSLQAAIGAGTIGFILGRHLPQRDLKLQKTTER
ncbi:MAG: energy-coupling factor ABC transporter substrate-binding protein [Acidaminobacter sp.]|uniref:energy-coupling factor ABC transporter substrate-binding protein n=1 Tax=Acidaminobacter sp. TaxID=1872102 RepID=UPI001380BE75|nr:energy-coupling factor ABC transporter substrate-binding protein [Acidaminobacter sp.]MZQ98974.1 energy-coupling factor ABC transporter substrate-binding protein [Acidaminobacter sp.]